MQGTKVNHYGKKAQNTSFDIYYKSTKSQENSLSKEPLRYAKNLFSLVMFKRSWKQLTNKDKFILLNQYIINENYLAVSLNLPETIINNINILPINKQSDKIRRWLNNSIKRNFGFLPNCCWLVAHEKHKPIHIHGFIELPIDKKKELEELLKKITFGVDALETTVEIKQIFASKGWLRYMTKDFSNTSKKVFDNIYIRRNLNSKIKECFYWLQDNEEAQIEVQKLYKEAKEKEEKDQLYKEQNKNSVAKNSNKRFKNSAESAIVGIIIKEFNLMFNPIKNPTEKQIFDLINESKHKAVRKITDKKTNDVYIWKAEESLHKEGADKLGIEYDIPSGMGEILTI